MNVNDFPGSENDTFEYFVKLLLFDPKQHLMTHLAALPSAACSTSEMGALLYFLQPRSHMVDRILQAVIVAEVENSISTTSLFRSNSIGVKLLCAFVTQKRMKLSAESYKPCYKIIR